MKMMAVHNGIFHADDVFGVALMQSIYNDLEIIRTRDEELLKTCDIVSDVGNGKYDHHHVDKIRRENGIPYCGFGLLWRDFGISYINAKFPDLSNLKEQQEVAEKVDTILIQQIDAQDNGVDVIGKKMTIVGAGGAATAIEVQAALDGVKELSIFNRKDEFYDRALETVRMINERTDCKATLFDLDDREALRREIADSYIFTNATGVGMKPLVGETYIEKDMLRPELIVSDVVYVPAKTRLLEIAEEVGCPTVNGLGLMLFQGAEAFKLWTGEEMPIAHMKEFLGIE